MKCAADGGCESKMCAMHKDMHKETEKSATLDKCLQCGCHKPTESHGLTQVVDVAATHGGVPVMANVTTAATLDTSGSIKSDEAEEVPAVTEEVAAETTEEVSEAPVVSEDDGLEAVVEKAVKSAMESVKAEIDSLRADKKAAVEKSVSLETELATALTKAVAGGPKRTATISGAQSNEYLVKAATYKAKAQATTDPVLAKGYMALYAEFSAKGGTPTDNLSN